MHASSVGVPILIIIMHIQLQINTTCPPTQTKRKEMEFKKCNTKNLHKSDIQTENNTCKEK